MYKLSLKGRFPNPSLDCPLRLNVPVPKLSLESVAVLGTGKRTEFIRGDNSELGQRRRKSREGRPEGGCGPGTGVCRVLSKRTCSEGRTGPATRQPTGGHSHPETVRILKPGRDPQQTRHCSLRLPDPAPVETPSPYPCGWRGPDL